MLFTLKSSTFLFNTELLLNTEFVFFLRGSLFSNRVQRSHKYLPETLFKQMLQIYFPQLEQPPTASFSV